MVCCYSMLGFEIGLWSTELWSVALACLAKLLYYVRLRIVGLWLVGL